MTLRLIITDHARQQMFDRGVEEEQIKKTIKRGSKIVQTDGFKSIYSYIGVCYKVRGDNYIIKTVTIE
ncbi:DUF4258 domain-containing protein [Candidatus Woesearchaeota archaeon]|nr:DUF4258 domain-containing protein [Candidatus Woesearchaeota archaeon]